MIFKAGTQAAIRWWKNGDHPSDNFQIVQADGPNGPIAQPTEGEYVGYYEAPPGMENLLHTDCGSAWGNHGFIESGGGRVVCPGNWIVQRANGHWDVVVQTITGVEDDLPLAAHQWFWYCTDDRETAGGGIDPEVVTQEAAAHSTEANHVVTLYGVLDGAEE